MNIFIYLILITSVHCYGFLKPINHSESLPYAKLFRDVINELYLRDKIPFDIVTVGEYTNQTRSLFHTLKYVMQNSPMQIKYFNPVLLTEKVNATIHKIEYRLIFNQSAIIMGIGNGVEQFNLRALLLNEFPKELRFLNFTKNLKKIVPRRFLTNSNTMNKTIELYEYFLYVNKTKVDFLTFEWFTADECNKGKIHKINTFDLKTEKWEKPLGGVERKFRNFHGCKIVATEFGRTFKHKLGNIIGSSYDVLNAVGLKANFTVYRQQREDPKNSSKILFRKKNLNFVPHIKCGIHSYNETDYHMTTSFENNKYTMMISKGQKYGSYEKLLLPFDVTTWCLLLLTFGIAFVVIFIVNHMSKQLQNLLYDGVHFPGFNVLGTFFGIAQKRVPTLNFPRILLMYFILFCLVIRTAYQGVFFKMMAADMRKHVPTSIDGLLEENYTIYAVKKHEWFNFFERIFAKDKNFNFKFVNEKQGCTTLKKAFNQRAAFITTELVVKHLSYRCITDYLILDSTFATFPIAMMMQRNHFMFHAINEVVEQTIPAGIPQHWFKIFLYYRLRHSNETFEDLESFKLEDWRFGFELWLACLGFSTIVFIIEILQGPKVKEAWSNYKKIIRKRKVIKVKVKRIQVKPLRNDKFWEELGKSLDFEVWEVKA